MRCLLLLDSSVHAAELVLNALDLAPRCCALLVIHLRGRRGRRARQSPGGAAHNRSHRLQIAQ